MKKSEFIVALKEKLGKSTAEADATLNTVLGLIQERLEAGDRITFTGFGTFEVRERKARRGVSIKTGKPIDIPPGFRPTFTAGAVLKESISTSHEARRAAPAPKKGGKKTATASRKK